jgi:hypothetical protein
MTFEEAIEWYRLGLYTVLGVAASSLALVMLARWGKQIFSS